MWHMVSHIGCMLQHCVDLNGRCYCQGGRQNSHQRVALTEHLADVIAMVAGGIATLGSVLF